ncbi:MAG TPA: hypothetical protein VL442_00180 [Mucilaginibacter sp.]|nr:hypothetical protein [Mucilaginibacter sp.]
MLCQTLLAARVVVNYQHIIEVVLATAAKVSSVFFHDSEGNVINRHDDADAKHRFAQNDEQHQPGVPFARLKQRGADNQVTKQNKHKAHRGPQKIPPPALNSNVVALTFRTL